MDCQEVLAVFVLCMASMSCQQDPNMLRQQQQPQHLPNAQMPNAQNGQPPRQDLNAVPQRRTGPPPHGQHQFREGARNREHVMEHLDGMVDRRPDETKMSEDEVQFHYFKLHDYNNDNRLDGIELVSALTHYHNDNPDEPQGQVKQLTDDELGNLVDTIFKEDDRNDDGYIDYPEFIVSQRT